jgi:tetratricopeptide (TPR) repeat protein
MRCAIRVVGRMMSLTPLIASTIILADSAAIPDCQSSPCNASIIVARISGCQEDISPSSSLFRWVLDAFSDDPAVDVYFIDLPVEDIQSMLGYFGGLLPGSFLILSGNAVMNGDPDYEVNCSFVMHIHHPARAIPSDEMMVEFELDSDRLDQETAPGIIYFACHSAMAMLYLQMDEITGADHELSVALESTDGVPEHLVAEAVDCRSRIAAISEAVGLIRSLSDSIEAGPENGRLFMRRAVENARAGYYDSSASDLLTAIELGPSGMNAGSEFAEGILDILLITRMAANDGAEIDTAIIQAVEESLMDALAYLDAAIMQDPENVESYLVRARVHGFLIEWTDARNDLTEAIMLDPECIQAYEARGSVNLEMGFTDEAIEDYSMAIGLAPDSSLFYEQRAWAYRMLGDEGRAAADLQTATRLSADEE